MPALIDSVINQIEKDLLDRNYLALHETLKLITESGDGIECRGLLKEYLHKAEVRDNASDAALVMHARKFYKGAENEQS